MHTNASWKGLSHVFHKTYKQQFCLLNKALGLLSSYQSLMPERNFFTRLTKAFWVKESTWLYSYKRIHTPSSHTHIHTYIHAYIDVYNIIIWLIIFQLIMWIHHKWLSISLHTYIITIELAITFRISKTHLTNNLTFKMPKNRYQHTKCQSPSDHFVS